MDSNQIVVTRALSLTQPWATLVAIEAKRYETRCWPTGYHGWIAIHAAKGFPRGCRDLCYSQPFANALAAAGFNAALDLPVGQVIAVARLTACVATRVWRPPADSDEYAFGDYSTLDEGTSKPRYSFKLEDVRRLREPFDCKGSLGIWKLARPIAEAELEEAQTTMTAPTSSGSLKSIN